MATYEDLLSTPVDKIEKPVPPPPGHYLFAVESFEPVTSAKKGTPGFKFNFKIYEPSEDIDAETLQAWGGMEKLQKIKVNDSFWVTADSLHRIKEFLEILYREPLAEGSPLKQYLTPELNGKTFIGLLTHRMADGSTDKYAQISKYLVANV